MCAKKEERSKSNCQVDMGVLKMRMERRRGMCKRIGRCRSFFPNLLGPFFFLPLRKWQAGGSASMSRRKVLRGEMPAFAARVPFAQRKR